MAVGNARPLDQARAARDDRADALARPRTTASTTARARCCSASCVRYDVGNVFDPAYTMVAKIAKRYLPELAA